MEDAPTSKVELGTKLLPATTIDKLKFEAARMLTSDMTGTGFDNCIVVEAEILAPDADVAVIVIDPVAPVTAEIGRAHV